MKPFTLDKHMLNMRGQFYPTGHILAAFPGEQAARRAVKLLTDAGVPEDEMSWLPPDTIMGELAHTVGSADIPLPSPGTEADTVRRFVDLASNGHWGLLIRSPDSEHNDLVTEALKRAQPSYAQKYRMLVIEDLVT